MKRFYVDALETDIKEEKPGRQLTIQAGKLLITFENLYGKEDSMLTLFFEVDDVPHFCKRMRMLGLDIEREWPDKAEMRDPDSRKIVIMESLL
jgi:hypothetical protein